MTIDLQNTRAIFSRYMQAAANQSALRYNAELAGEVQTRLEQLDFILSRIRTLDRERIEYIGRPNPHEPSDGKVLRSNAFEVRLFTEAFYYLAARIRTILCHKEEPCPLLKTFECPGARNVRNKLLEHPEGRDSRIFASDWAVGLPEGPRFKVHSRPSGVPAFVDQGLYVNTRELRHNLEDLLRKALASLGA